MALYPQAAALQKYSGIAPVTKRSGKSTWVHWRWQCPTFVRQTFVDWAAQTINKSAWAGAYYRQQRANGCSYQVAVRGLAFKLIPRSLTLVGDESSGFTATRP